MQREMLSHFITLSNKMSTRGGQKDGPSTCMWQVKKYTQNSKEWPISELRGSCWRTAMLLLEIKWGFGDVPLRKRWNSGIRLYSRNPEKPRKISWNSQPPKITPLGLCAVPQCFALPLNETLRKSLWNLCKNSPICKGWSPAQSPSINPPANPQSRTSARRNCVIPLRPAQSSTVLNPPANYQRNCCKNTDGTTLPEQALEVPRG